MNASRRPVIGLMAGRFNHSGLRDELPRVTIGLEIEYIRAVTQSGGAPVLLPSEAGPESASELTAAIDGLLLTGGGDMVSLHYGQQPHPTCAAQDPVRDKSELAIARAAVERGLPILGLCRGQQVLNVVCGGSLVQDIPSQCPDAIQHKTRAWDVVLGHTISIEPGSLLAGVLGTHELAVNSRHHQAVGDVGDGLRVSARAVDGVPEGLESSQGRPWLAVQCHPEECTNIDPRFRRLFDWLVGEARAFHTNMGVARAS